MTLIETINKSASTARWVGIFMIIAGLLAIATPLATGISVTLVTGFLLLAAGVAQIFLAFRSGGLGESIMLVLLGLLSVLAGGYMLTQPGLALGVLTLFLAGFFIAEGVIEIVAAIRARPAPGWAWFLFGGVVSLLLGIMIWRQFPLSGAWAIGTLVGLRLFMSGISLTAIGSGVKEIASETRD